MRRARFIFHNKRQIIILISGLVLFFLITILIPALSIIYLKFSGISIFFMENMIYSIISGILLLYQFVIGEYYYNIMINKYVIEVTSYRPIFDFFNEKNYLESPIENLVDYAVFNRPLSLNKTLMLRIKNSKGKKITKRFNLTLISKKDLKKISSVLDRVIEKNN